ncbi:hypothetical protein BKI52_18585 [marine bacterium AO1-C]|nr:hypothetical protein BKI52_18585 [marine bacterium AO1-C]
MKKVKFYFKLTSKGSLNNVFFYPEKEDTKIRLKVDSEGKKWESTEFELLVEDPFDYSLTVFGVSGTKWEAELKLVNKEGRHSFIKWEGVTGDTRRNISKRTKPVKNIPKDLTS